MSLYERLAGSPGATKMPVHGFCAACRLAVLGVTGFNVASISSTFSLSAGEQAELTALANTYAGLGTAALRQEWVAKLESVFVLAESGILTEQQAKTILGF